MIAAPHDGRGVIGHHVERDGDGGGQAIDDLRQRIAHQQDIAMRIKQLRLARGVGREHHQRFTRFPVRLVRPDLGHCKPFHRLRCGIGTAGAGIELEGCRHGRSSSNRVDDGKAKLGIPRYSVSKGANFMRAAAIVAIREV